VDALAAGAFGVPSFAVDGELFWGQDRLPLLRRYLMGD
jgi:2-hydroxychromene-2-carboxylate isomerase